MERTSPLYYISPSAIGITPNCNGSANDLAVYIAKDTKVKVFYPDISALGTSGSDFQEWTLRGRNRRLADASVPYTIYARLTKSGDKTAYLVFAQQIPDGSGWKDPYVLSPNTSSTTSVTLNDADGKPHKWAPLPERQATDGRSDYWWVKIGEVTAPENGQRTVDLDTGILGTDQWNVEWNLTSDNLPLRVELTNSKGVGVPYVAWGEQITINASLVEGWETAADDQVRYWTIERITDKPTADTAWNHPNGEDTIKTLKDRAITLKHLLNDTDDFDAAVAASFVVTAWGDNPEYVETNDSDNPDDEDTEQEPQFIALAKGSMTILAEALVTYELEPSAHCVVYSPATDSYIPKDGIRLRIKATAQDGTTSYLTKQQAEQARLSLYYSIAGNDSHDGDTDLELEGGTDSEASVLIPVSVFATLKQSINVHLTNAAGHEYAMRTIAYLRDGESITKKNETYRYATNNTGVRPASTSSDWKTVKPALEKGYWLYTETTIHWSDNTTTVLYTDERNPNDGIKGQDIIVDGATVIKYYVGDSNTTHPAETSGDWKDLSQVTQTQGKWLWSKATTFFRKADSAAGSHDAGSSSNYNVSYIAKDGDTGRGVVGITEYYKATNSSTAMDKPDNDAGWSTDPNLGDLSDKWDKDHRYLWNYERVEYSSGTQYERTVPQVLAIWTEDGEDGEPGRGIDSITNYYKVTNSATPPARFKNGTEEIDDDWEDNPMAPSESDPYLWNFEVITWTSGEPAVTYTDVQLIGHYGRNGEQGEDAVYAVLSPDTYTIDCDSNGHPITDGTMTIYAFLYKGNNRIADKDEKITDVSVDGSFPSTIAADISGNTLTVSYSTTHTFTTSLILHITVYSATLGISRTAQTNVHLAKQGAKGDDAVIYNIFFDAYTASYDSDSGELTASFTCHVIKTIGDVVTTPITTGTVLYNIGGDTTWNQLTNSNGERTGSISPTTYDTLPSAINFRYLDINNVVVATTSQPISIIGATGVGKTGRMYYMAGEWKSNTPYTCTDELCPVVYYNNGTEQAYWYMKSNGTSTDDTPSDNSAVWAKLPNFGVVLTDAIFVKEFAQFGSGIFTGDWLISVHGTINGVSYGGTVENPDKFPSGSAYAAYTYFNPNYPNSAPQLRTLVSSTMNTSLANDSTGWYDIPDTIVRLVAGCTYHLMFTIRTSSASHTAYVRLQRTNGADVRYLYGTANTSYVTAEADYTPTETGDYHLRLSTTYGSGGTSYAYLSYFAITDNYNFIPNYAVDLRTGKSYQQNAYIQGEVHATSGEFNGVVRSNAVFKKWQDAKPNDTIDLSLGTGVKYDVSIYGGDEKIYYLPDAYANDSVEITMGCFAELTTKMVTGPGKVYASGDDVIWVNTPQEGDDEYQISHFVKGIQVPLNRVYRLHSIDKHWVFDGDESDVYFF